MARQHITLISDDLGDPGVAREVLFSYEGQRYEIDLNEVNAEGLEEIQRSYRQAMQAFLDHARPVARQRSGDTAAARIWARERGYVVPSRGPLPTAMLEEYHSYLDAGGVAPEVTRATPARSESAETAQKVREWAASNGYAVNPRGPISSTLIDAYRSRTQPNGRNTEAKELRVWAAQNGIKVAPRGPVSTSILQRYRESIGA